MKALTTEQLLPLVKNGMPDAYRAYLHFYTSTDSIGCTPIVHNGQGFYGFAPILEGTSLAPMTPGAFIYFDDYIAALAGGAE